MTRVNVKNKQGGFEYVNGTTGYVVSTFSDHIVIRTMEGKLVTVNEHVFSITDSEGDVQASTSPVIPVLLAFSVTIHRSQGSNLSKALVDLSGGGKWASGLNYTALSRLTSSSGLRISSINFHGFYTDPKVLQFYNKVRYAAKIEKDLEDQE